MANRIGGGLFRRRNLMSENSVQLLTFESVTGAQYADRYGNSPLSCNIYDNHIEYNTAVRNSGNWYTGGNLSAYNSQNKEWLFISMGTVVKLRAKSNPDARTTNFKITLNDSTSTGLVWGWLSVQPALDWVENTKTATNDFYVYVGFVDTPNKKREVDIEIYLDGVRVL